MNDPADEIQLLHACINDMVSLLGLPALWNGQDSVQVVGILLDVLLRTLRVDFAYARLSGTNGGSWTEAVRIAPNQRQLHQPRELERALEPCLALDATSSGCVIGLSSTFSLASNNSRMRVSTRSGSLRVTTMLGFLALAMSCAWGVQLGRGNWSPQDHHPPASSDLFRPL